MSAAPKIAPLEVLDDILRLATQRGASDVHLKAGIIPVVRKHGNLRALSSSYAPFTQGDLEDIALALMNEQQREQFEKTMDIDLSYGLPGIGRFRINLFKQRGTFRIVIRNIPDKVLSISELNLPPVVEKLADTERGLILVTGTTGSGKSSTLAGIINHINQNKSKHILMIEDPTEFLIRDKKSIITQRELGTDTISFANSLRAALRQDPDIILIGEMRDKETIEIALQAAETGHLVLSTLHTLDAQETINRILAAFEPHHQAQIRLQMATVLRAVLSQRLCRLKEGKGYIPALEVLINNARVAECIAEPSRTAELRTIMEEGRSAWSMSTFDQSLMDLVHADMITYEEALKNSTSPENFAIRYSGVSHGEGEDWDKNATLRARLEEQWQGLTEMEVETSVKTKTSFANELRREKVLKGIKGLKKRKPK